METATENGLWTATNDEYHADTSHVSHSALEVFRRSSRLYHARYVAKTIPAPEPTPAMVIGSALHCLVLEPDAFEYRYAVAPQCDRRTKAGKETWAAFQDRNGHCNTLDSDDFLLVTEIAAAVRQHPLARKLLDAPGRREQSIRWTDAATGVECKARFDGLLDVGIVLDIKTTSDPRPDDWARSAHGYGFHRQSAFYRRGRQAVLGVDVQEPFLHVVVSKEPPHEVAVYELDYAAWQLGDGQIQEMLWELRRCRQNDEWENDWQVGIKSIALPKWAFHAER